MTLLAELADTTRTVTDRLAPAVVRIGRGGGRGGGVVVAPGRVLTNAHNLRGPQTTVTFAEGRTEIGTAVGVDLDGDLAVLDVDTADVEPVALAEGEVRSGDVVFAVVRTAAGGVRTTWGPVTGTERAFRGPRGRRIGGSVEHAAPLASRSSGSPVADAEGRVVGLNTSRVGDAFYLAIPADADLRARIERLAAGQAPPQRHLGLALAPPEVARRLRAAVGLPERDGLLVREVDPDQPAGRAGVQQGDLVVRAGDRDVTSVDDLHAALDAAGDAIELLVVRGADERTIEVSFAPAENDAD